MDDTTRPFFPPNQIFLFDNVVPDDICDKIINFLNKADENILEQESYKPGSNVICKSINVEKIRDYYLRTTLDSEIFNSISEIIQKLSKHKIISTVDTGYCLRKITGPTRWHYDATVSDLEKYKKGNLNIPNTEIRNMSVIIALNSDYEGGEFCFPEQNTMIKLKKGQALAFPPYWTHPHYTNDLKNGTYRYTINTWLCE